MIPRRHQLMLLFLILAFVFMFVGSACGVENFSELDKALAEQQATPEIQPNNLVLNFIKLVLVLGLILAAAWAVIKLFGRQVGTKMQGNWLHIVDEVMLGQNRGIVLCEISDKVYALGVTDGQISTLFEINDPALLDEIRQQDQVTNNHLTISKFKLTSKMQGKINGQNKKNFHLLMQEQLNRVKDFSKETK